MSTIQSSSSPIGGAANAYRNVFFLYIAVLVVAAIATVVLTVLLWKAGNRYSAEVGKDADARISESNAEAKRAGESAGLANERAGIANATAGKANERAEKLERDNLTLRKDLETATAESRAKQAELATEQTKLSTEQRKTAEAQRQAAEAQKALAEVVERRTAARHLTPDQSARIIAFLQASPKGEVWIASQGDDNDANTFALELSAAISAGGWKISRSTDIGIQYRPGLLLAVNTLATQPLNGRFLLKALTDAGWPPTVVQDAQQVEPGELKLIIGPRPK